MNNSTDTKPRITVSATIAASIDKVWQLWNAPEHITQWNNPSPEWYTPRAEADLQPGGRFSYRIEARRLFFISGKRGVFLSAASMVCPVNNTEWTILFFPQKVIELSKINKLAEVPPQIN